MAKRRKGLLKLRSNSSVQPKVIPLPSNDGLPPYSRYFDTSSGVRFFFEPAQSTEETSRILSPSISNFCYAGKHAHGGMSVSFFPRAKKVLGAFSECLARQVIYYGKIISGSKNTLSNFNLAISYFVDFVEFRKIKITSFKEITQDILVLYGDYLISENKSITNLTAFKRLLLTNSQVDKKSIKQISDLHFKNRSSEVNEKVDFEEGLNQDYSDKELIQILAYCYYELDNMVNRVSENKNVEETGLGKNDISLETLSSSNEKLISLFKSGPEGFDILINNIILHNKPRTKTSISKSASYTERLRTRTISLGLENEFEQFQHYLRKNLWVYRSRVLTEKEVLGKALQNMHYLPLINGTAQQYTFCLSVYLMISTGINFSVLRSWKRVVNGKPWYENFDKFFGSDEGAPSRDRSILMIGIKDKTGVTAAKKIPTSIPINSPIFKYLKAYDEAHDPNREYFIASKEKSLSKNALSNFIMVNPIYDDKGERLNNIIPKRFRKVFAGHKLMSLLGDVRSADELIYKLRESLNHSTFDTTLFSYIMKSGVGNQILDTAIVALTSDLLEKSLRFNGKIRTADEKSQDSIPVFLCDCENPQEPTHGLPIRNDHCRKYDMCLGCERSEVYAEHIPKICYRVLQYEEMRENNHEIYRISVEDRHAIALDTLKRFEFEHVNGTDLLEASYLKANECFINNNPLLPPILQTEKL